MKDATGALADVSIRDDGDVIIFEVKVVPRASRDRIGPVVGQHIKVQLTAPPIDGAANDGLRALLAKALGVARGQVTIVRGETSRRKTVRVSGASRDALMRVLAER